VIQVLAKAPRAHGDLEVLAVSGEDPNIDRVGARASEPANRLLLDRGEKLALQPFRQETHFVEKERSPVRRLEQPGLGLLCIRERSALEAEELRFEQVLGNRGAVDVHEGPGRSRARAVDGMRN